MRSGSNTGANITINNKQTYIGKCIDKQIIVTSNKTFKFLFVLLFLKLKITTTKKKKHLEINLRLEVTGT